MDYSEIVKVVETTSSDDVNKYLATKRWCVLSVSSGRMEDGTAYHLYSLGWYGLSIPIIRKIMTVSFPLLPRNMVGIDLHISQREQISVLPLGRRNDDPATLVQHSGGFINIAGFVNLGHKPQLWSCFRFHPLTPSPSFLPPPAARGKI